MTSCPNPLFQPSPNGIMAGSVFQRMMVWEQRAGKRERERGWVGGEIESKENDEIDVFICINQLGE